MLSFSKMKFPNAPILVIVLLALATILAACGDSATSTPVPTTAAVTTATVTTAAIITIPTSTTSSTSKTTASRTTATGSVSAADPVIAEVVKSAGNFTEVPLDQAFLGSTLRSTPGAVAKMYVSTQAVSANVTSKMDAAAAKAGYSNYTLPAAVPISPGVVSYGFYNKDDTADLLVLIENVPASEATLAKNLNVAVDTQLVQKLFDEIKGKKTFLYVTATPGVLKKAYDKLGSATT